jgi:hypothetical protein
MTTLENLYHGNINPCENKSLLGREDYKKLLEFVSRAQEKLSATLSEEQRKLFENYIMNAEELSVITEQEMFNSGFSLAVKIITEVYNTKV